MTAPGAASPARPGHARCETCGHPRRTEIAIALTRGDLHHITTAIRRESTIQTAVILRALGIEEEQIVGALDNLKAADQALKDEVVAFLADIAGRLGNPDADVQAVADDITAEVAALKAGDPATQPVAGDPVAGAPDAGDDPGQ